MNPINKSIEIYRDQLQRGDVPAAYSTIISFMQEFRNMLSSKYSENKTMSTIYQGYMDMSYFAFTPLSLAEKKLKIAIVFIHETISFELWLSAANKTIQKKYWHQLKNKSLNSCDIPTDLQGKDYIISKPVSTLPDFEKPDDLMKMLEDEAMDFIEAISAGINE